MVFEPSPVPVVIEYHIQTIIDTIVDYGLHPFHPNRIDGLFLRIDNMSQGPGARNSDRAESLFLYIIDHFLCCSCTLPGDFGIESALVVPQLRISSPIAGLERVAKVPSRHHLISNLHSRFIEAILRGQA